MQLVFAIVFVGAVIAIIFKVARSILGPYDQAAKALKRPTRYQIVDFFCLIVELQLVFACFALVDLADVAAVVAVSFICLSVLAMWYTGVTVLSHAGIEDPWRRAAFNWFVLPMTYVGSLAIGGGQCNQDHAATRQGRVQAEVAVGRD